MTKNIGHALEAYVDEQAEAAELERVSSEGPTTSAAVQAYEAGIAKWKTLTDQQLVVAKLLALGKTAPEIAAELDVSDKTVYTHRAAIFRKIGVRNTVELARDALRFAIVAL